MGLDEKNPEAVIDHLLRQDFKHLSDFSFTLMTRIISGIARFGISTLIRENYPGDVEGLSKNRSTVLAEKM